MPANFTKRAIMEAFLTLAAKKSLQKITVKDIVDECGINRNTFYYHFQDIYALVDELFLSFAENAVRDVSGGATWVEAFVSAAEEMARNRSVFMNISRSIGREKLDEYFNTVSKAVIPKLIDNHTSLSTISESDLAMITSFYSYAICGLWAEWLSNGMREPPRELLERISRLFSEGFYSAVRKASEGKS